MGKFPDLKKTGVDVSRHRQGSGWQTRDRETLPSRTANMRRVSGASPKSANPLSEKRFQAVEGKLFGRAAGLSRITPSLPCAPSWHRGPGAVAVREGRLRP